MRFKTPNLAGEFSNPEDDFEEITVETEILTSKTPDNSITAEESGDDLNEEEDQIQRFDGEGNPIDEEGNIVAEEEEEEEGAEEESEEDLADLKQQEEEFVTSALGYYKENDEDFDMPEGVKDVDSLREVISNNAIKKELETKGSYWREAIKTELMEEMGISEEEVQVLRGNRHGIDQKAVNEMKSLKSEMAFQYTPETEAENRKLYETYYTLQNQKKDEIDILVEAKMAKIKADPVAGQAELNGVKTSISNFADKTINDAATKIGTATKAMEDQALERRREQEAVFATRMIGGKKRSLEEIKDFKKKLTVRDQEIIENGVKKKVSLFYKVFKEMPIADSLALAHNLLYKEEAEDKKEDKKQKTKRKATGKFLKRQQKRERIPDARRVNHYEEEGEEIVVNVPIG